MLHKPKENNLMNKLSNKENKKLNNFNFLQEYFLILRSLLITENQRFKIMEEEHLVKT